MQKVSNLLTFLKTNVFFIITGIMLVVYLLTGFSIHTDYGISWDEPFQYHYGQVIWDYVQGKNQALLTDSERHYGPVVPAFFTLVEKLSKPETSQDIYFQRHLLNFLIHFLGCLAFVGVLYKRFKSGWICFLGSAMYILSPRFFAESFYNSKDLPFMAFSVLTLDLGFSFIATQSWIWLVLSAVSAAVLTDSRILGLIIVPVLLGAAFLRRKSFTDFVIKKLSFVGIYASVTLLLWPTLWTNPIPLFIEAFQRMSHYPWEGTVLYLGEFIKSTELPWHYPFVWIGITTPVVYLILMATGIAVYIQTIVKDRLTFLNSLPNVLDTVMILWLSLPLILVTGLRSVLYDGWRHLYFIYPAMLYVGCLALWFIKDYLSSTSQSIWIKRGCFAALALYLGWIGVTIVSHHPYQNVYFNLISGDRATLSKRFETDYWGLSYREGLRYIAQSHSTPVTVFPALFPGYSNGLLLSEADKKIVIIVNNPQQAQYFITNFRWHPEDYPFPESYSVTVDQVKLLSVYTLR